MNTVKRSLSIWNYIIYVSIILSILGRLTILFVSCTEETIFISEEPHSGQKITVLFSLKDVEIDDNETIINNSGDINTQTVDIPINNEPLRFTSLKIDQHSEGQEAVSNLTEGAKLRIVAYLGGTTYRDHADYTIVGGILTAENHLQVYVGSYKFVAYSHNNSTTLPLHHDCSIAEIDPSIDLLWGYYPETGTFQLTESTVKTIPIAISPKVCTKKL